MALQVIGAGFGRTGTLSLKTALEKLGFVRCHHMQEVAPRGSQVRAWLARARGEAVDWDAVFAGFQASCDWPSAAYWEELAEHYPDSKVILTVRDPESWYRSVDETIYRVSRGIPGWLLVCVPHLRRFRELVERTVWGGVFDDRFEDKEHALRVFQANTEHVQRVLPPERLLVFEAKHGWEPLCTFLGVPVPDEPYPHVNDTASVKRALVVIEGIRWLPLALLAGALAAWAL